jgi:hypothetical protein
MPCCEEVGVTSFQLGILIPQKHTIVFDQLQSRAISKLSRKVLTQKCLLQSSAPFHLWAHARSGAVDPTHQDFLGARVNLLSEHCNSVRLDSF